MEKIIKIIAAIFIVLVLPILLYIFWLYKDSPLSCHQTLVINCISCLIAIANALLLFATLLNQGRSFKQERFESTLFYLLESHRKLMNTIHIRMEYKDVFVGTESIDVDEGNMFDFVHQEIKMVKEVLKRDSFQFLSENDVSDRMSNIENVKYSSTKEAAIEIDKKKRELNKQYQLSQRCSMYGINESIWAQKENNADEQAFVLFLKKWERQLAPYLRSLMLMFNHIAYSKLDRVERVRYRSYIIHQMQDKELYFLKLNYLYNGRMYSDNTFKSVLDKISKDGSFVKKEKATFFEN